MKSQLKPPQKWLRLIIATQVSFVLVASELGCTSRAKRDADSESVQQEGAQGADGDFANEIGSDAGSVDGAGNGIGDALAQEELGAPAQQSTIDIANDIAAADAIAAETTAAASPEPSVAPEAPRASGQGAQQNQAPSAAGNQSFTGNYAEVAITDIKYLSKKGGGTVVVETSSPATYHTREVPGQNQAIIEIANAQLPDRLKRPYVTKDFGQEITSVMAYQDKGSTTVRVVVQFRTSSHAEVKQDGRSLLLASGEVYADVNDNPTLGDMGGDNPALTDAEASQIPGAAGPSTVSANGGAAAAARYGDRDPRILPQQSIDPASYDNVKFFGRAISIEVRDTPVRDVLNLIAEQSGANIVLAGEIDGSITLKLRQIPWDQALLIVMKTRNLGYIRQGSILRVAPYDSLQKESEAAKRVIDAQKAAEPLRVKVVPVGYAKVDDLKERVTPFLTNARGKIVSDARTNSLIITDTPDVLERVGNLIKALDLPPLQVLIEGKVVEARESFGRQAGVNWGFNGQAVDAGSGRSALGSFNTTLALPTGGGGAANFRIGQFDIFGDINARLALAESEDQVKIISSPRIVALNNEKAEITQGTNIAISSFSVANGVTVANTTYTEVPMKLEVTPQVTSENDVIMQINIKRDFAGNRTGTNAPDINKREAKTKVLVRNGATAVVGGVYQSDTTENETGLPWLRSVPVLGWIFKRRSVTQEKSELLVFLTPRILNADTSLQKESTL